MHHSPLIAPVVAMVAWTIVMLLWAAAVRLPAMKKAKLPPKRGGRGQDLEGVLPDEVNWPNHNFSNLTEQPPAFYAIVLCLVALGADQQINVWLAWGYVAFRVLHSIVQSTINDLRFRTPLFLLATFCLVCLTVHATLALLYH